MTSGPLLGETPFFFMRHGETDWNRIGLCVGQVDRKLTGRGRRQARDARRTVTSLGIAHVVHSPLSRAAETARIVAKGCAYEVTCEDDLREACLGVKEGLREDDPNDDFVAQWLGGGFIPGAEPYEQFKERVAQAVRKSIARATHGPVLLIAHWAVFAAISELVGQCVSDTDHCVPYRLAPVGAGWQITQCSVSSGSRSRN